MNKPNHPAVMATDAVETWLAGARRDIPMGPRRPFQRSPRCGAKGWRLLPPSGDRPVSLVSAHTLAPDWGCPESANFAGVDAEPSATLTCSNIGIHDQA